MDNGKYDVLDDKNNKLKPCPFCGGEAELYESKECWRIYCIDENNVDCILGALDYDYMKPSRDEAIKAWNTRKGES